MRLAVVVLLAGCGRVAYDGRPDADGRCREPWSAPTRIELGAGFWEGASLRGDGLELFVGGNGDLHVATRATQRDPFGPATLLPSPPNRPEMQSVPAISDDGLELLHTVTITSNAFVFHSVRASVTSPFPDGAETGAYGSVDVSADRLTVYTSDYQAPIRRQTRATPDGPLGPRFELPAPVNVASGFSGAPSVSSDDLELYFDSDRDGERAPYVAHRASPTEEFSTVERLDLPGFLRELEISADGHFLYFTGTDYNIYMVSRCE